MSNPDRNPNDSKPDPNPKVPMAKVRFYIYANGRITVPADPSHHPRYPTITSDTRLHPLFEMLRRRRDAVPSCGRPPTSMPVGPDYGLHRGFASGIPHWLIRMNPRADNASFRFHPYLPHKVPAAAADVPAESNPAIETTVNDPIVEGSANDDGDDDGGDDDASSAKENRNDSKKIGEKNGGGGDDDSLKKNGNDDAENGEKNVDDASDMKKNGDGASSSKKMVT